MICHGGRRRGGGTRSKRAGKERVALKKKKKTQKNKRQMGVTERKVKGSRENSVSRKGNKSNEVKPRNLGAHSEGVCIENMKEGF